MIALARETKGPGQEEGSPRPGQCARLGDVSLWGCYFLLASTNSQDRDSILGMSSWTRPSSTALAMDG